MFHDYYMCKGDLSLMFIMDPTVELVLHPSSRINVSNISHLSRIQEVKAFILNSSKLIPPILAAYLPKIKLTEYKKNNFLQVSITSQ